MTNKIIFCDNLAATFVSHRIPLVEFARAGGWDSIAAVPLPHDEITARGITCVPVKLARKGLNPLTELLTLVQLITLFRCWSPAVVHLRTPKMWIYGGIAARLAGVPGVVSHITGIGSAMSGRTWRSRAARIALTVLAPLCFGHPRQRVIAQNRDDAAVLLRLRCPRRKLRLIRGSGVDCVALQPSPEPSGLPLVVLPARMLADKGVREFIAAAGTLRQRGVALRCALVGACDPGNPSAISEAELRQAHDTGVVEWWGYQKDMAGVLAQAHVVCLPSYYGEGLPKSLLEAMACGRAVVTCNSPGCREPVIPEVTGLLVPPRDAVALADALERLIRDPALRQRMGAAGRAHCEAHFDLPRILELTYGAIAAVGPQGAAE